MDSTAELAIRLRGVVKRYGAITAVDGLDLDVPEGTCVGLLGPNGAGKSTTMRLLTAQAIADEGELEVLGFRLPAESKQARGEPGFPMEQLVRDAEMYRIGEGATDILRPFVAREALSPHLERARVYLEGGLTRAAKRREWLKLLRGYVPWYLGLLRRRPLPDRRELRHRKVSEKLLFAERASRRVARTILYAMARYGEALRDDVHFSYVAAWEYAGAGKQPVLDREPLNFEYVHPAQRSYK